MAKYYGRKHISNKDMSLTNKHQGHIASCLCCQNLSGTMGEPGYSEYTPGSPGSVHCIKGVFEFGEGDGWGFLAVLHDEARHCKFFEAKD